MIYLFSEEMLEKEVNFHKQRKSVKLEDIEIKKMVIYEMVNLGYDSRDSVKVFTKCEDKCGGFVEGRYVSEKYNDIGILSGSSGIHYKCNRCGTELASTVLVMS